MILTSRETDKTKDIKEYMDTKVVIKGFSQENVEKYITQSLKSEDKTKQLLDQARVIGIYLYKWYDCGLLAIPIFLNMICVLFECNPTLPNTTTGIMQAIVDRCMDRGAIRLKGQKSVDTAKRALYNLGKLAGRD